ncbi:MAG TPA: ABC transporter substrate-binding protein [Solirubrobacteraceae bacterium]|nr:ABC transporter substrate-binding protein [Solirubrobacteraceae bacterium]
MHLGQDSPAPESLGGELSRRDLLRRVGAGGVALLMTGVLAACGGASSSSVSTASGPPRRGGTVHLALSGGSSADVPDPHVNVNATEVFYSASLYDQLNQIDENFVLRNRLAQEITPNKDGSQWTVRLKAGIEFQNGKTVGADDVIYSFQRIFNPKTHATNQWLSGLVASMTKIDPLTMRFDMHDPVGWFDVALGDGGVNNIVPVGFDLSRPIGTGPWRLTSFSPGVQATMVANRNFWDGTPFLDEMILPVINDDTARLNALLSGQVHVVSLLLPSQVTQVQQTSGLRVWNSPSGAFTPITMRVDTPPFDDVRVRQALRLCLNRQQVLEEGFSGYGFIGADLYAPFDPAYDKSLKRSQDLEEAKSLLKQAGRSDLNVELVTSDLVQGTVQQCEVLAQNASQIGATINVRVVDSATLFGPNYLSWPFAVDTYPALTYMTTSALADGPFASINETHFNLPRYEALWKQASAELDASRRDGIVVEMQQILYDQGGYIIWGFGNLPGAYSSKLAGFPTRDVRGYGFGAQMMQKAYFVS